MNADEQLNLATTDMEESISAASSVANMRAFDMVRFYTPSVTNVFSLQAPEFSGE